MEHALPETIVCIEYLELSSHYSVDRPHGVELQEGRKRVSSLKTGPQLYKVTQGWPMSMYTYMYMYRVDVHAICTKGAIKKILQKLLVLQLVLHCTCTCGPRL